MNILYLSSHAILEYDQTKLWTDLGYSVFSIGAYTDPTSPTVDLRPAIDAPYYSDLAALCHEQRARHAADGHDAGYPVIDWAKADLHPKVIDWADTIIVDCYPESWITFNWSRIRDKRVVWRTIGQSGYETEIAMRALHEEGLQIVRYSPAEKRAYGKFDWFAGEDALIRFGKDPADWYGWTGERAMIGNLAQHDTVPHGRDAFLNWGFLEKATEGLPLEFAGPNSEKIGGLGALGYDEMRQKLREWRAYIYTGTQPASYTLGLIEALMTGTPVVSIGPGNMRAPELFEGAEIALDRANDARWAWTSLNNLLNDWTAAVMMSGEGRQRAIELFSTEVVGRQWVEFLGAPMSGHVTFSTEPPNIEPEPALVSAMVVGFDPDPATTGVASGWTVNLPALGGITNSGPGAASISGPFRVIFGREAVTMRRLRALAARTIATLRIVILGRGVVLGNRPASRRSPFLIGHRHDDNDSTVSS